MRYTVTYDRLKATAERKVTCPGCGRKRTIKRTFHQTVSPFNRHAIEDRANTTAEVQRNVRLEAEAWEPVSRELYHGACWQVAPARSGDDS